MRTLIELYEKRQNCFHSVYEKKIYITASIVFIENNNVLM